MNTPLARRRLTSVSTLVVGLYFALLLVALFIPTQTRALQSKTFTGARSLAQNCTYTLGYWKNHPQAWPVESLVIGGQTYTHTQLIAILKKSPRGDATYILARQLIAAKLNIAQGADDSAVADVITEADAWLAEHPLGSKPRNPEREEGIAYAAILDDYNNGRIGPGHCGKVTPTPTPTPGPEE